MKLLIAILGLAGAYDSPFDSHCFDSIECCQGSCVPEYTYDAGAKVSNDRPDNSCSSWYGSLEDAKAKCDVMADCIGIHDWGADGKNWRTCTSFKTTGTLKAASMLKRKTGTKCEAGKGLLETKHKKTLWVEGPKAVNLLSQHDCSSWYGSLEDAQKRCGADETCAVLHDWNSDGKNWRYCKSVKYNPVAGGADTMVMSTHHRCYKDENHPNKCACQCDSNPITGTKQHTHVYIDGGKVSNDRPDNSCSSWYGSLEDAKARCDVMADCIGIHDWGADGKNWRTCTSFKTTGTLKAASMLKQ